MCVLLVRHKEFTRNLKREYQKLMHVIQCYCLIAEGVKLSCVHVVGNKSTSLMSTQLKNSLRENIIEIFGLSAIKTMVKFEQCEPDEDTLVEYKLKAQAPAKTPASSNESSQCRNDDDDECSMIDLDPNQTVLSTTTAAAETTSTFYSNMFQIEGYISSCSHNQGRSAPGKLNYCVRA